jgi:hypothetical protein
MSDEGEADAEIKLAAYVDMLEEYPAGCFTKRTLRQAAETFKFFPSYAELVEFLNPIRSDINERRMAARDHRQLEHDDSDNVIVLTPEEIERRMKALDGLKRRLRSMP